MVERDDRADGPQADGVWADGPQEDGPRADGPQADGPQEELSPGNRVRADRAMLLQTEEDQLIEVSGMNRLADPLYFLLDF